MNCTPRSRGSPMHRGAPSTAPEWGCWKACATGAEGRHACRSYLRLRRADEGDRSALQGDQPRDPPPGRARGRSPERHRPDAHEALRCVAPPARGARPPAGSSSRAKVSAASRMTIATTGLTWGRTCDERQEKLRRRRRRRRRRRGRGGAQGAQQGKDGQQRRRCSGAARSASSARTRSTTSTTRTRAC